MDVSQAAAASVVEWAEMANTCHAAMSQMFVQNLSSGAGGGCYSCTGSAAVVAVVVVVAAAVAVLLAVVVVATTTEASVVVHGAVVELSDKE